jgi:hypothetical protein
MDNLLQKAVGVLFEMDNFVMSVYDNERWLTLGVPDGEFEENSIEEAEANYKEHCWLITDFDGGFDQSDYQEFISTFRYATRNKRDYDQNERDRIIQKALSILETIETKITDGVARHPGKTLLPHQDGEFIKESNGEGKMNTPKHFTKEQVNAYLKKAKEGKLNEQLMMEGPFDGIKDKLKDMKASGDVKKAQSNAQRIIKNSKDPEIASAYKFIIDGKEYDFNKAKTMSDEQIANAIVVDKYGYYIRRGLQDVEKKHEFRHSSKTDWVKDEYKLGGGASADADKGKGKGKGEAEADGAETAAAEKLPPLKGDHRDWSYKLPDGRVVDWADLQTAKKEGEISSGEFKNIVVFDTKKKKYSWEDANKVIEVQMKNYRDGRAANDAKKLDKQAKADKKAADKEQKKADKAERDEIGKMRKHTTGSTKAKKPVGKLRFYDEEGNEIGERQYKKLTTDEKRKYTARDKSGNEFTYNDLLNHRKTQKRLNASLENDPNREILESLDWDRVKTGFNESYNYRKVDDKFTDSYSLSKEDVEYDDDISTISY